MEKLARRAVVDRLEGLLKQSPVVALLGARQVGKTTLARMLAARRRGAVTHFDLELPSDLARLADPELGLAELRGLVVLDEVQRRPELFPVLRALVDRPEPRARFLVLGSASPELLRQTSETLAGRVAFLELGGLALDEVGAGKLPRLWLRGGFPPAFLAPDDQASGRWRRDFIRTFLERDLPQLGVRIPATTLHRFWSMLAHLHGAVLNLANLGRSMGVSDPTVRGYLDLLAATFVVRQLGAWSENLGKRQVKAPKVYIADSGLLHTLLGVTTRDELERHPAVGASWEGFLVAAVAARLRARPDELYFWRTHAGAELDLLVVRGGRRLGFEFKRTTAPTVTRSMHIARADLRLDSLDLVHAGKTTFPLAPGVRALAASRILTDLEPL